MKTALNPILFFVLLLCVVWLGYFTPREDMVSVLGLYGLAFAAYGALLWREAYKNLSMFLLLGVLLRIVLFASEPAFSDDHHRFIWDGQLVAQGENPYAELPSALEIHAHPNLDEALYEKLNSKKYYSVYPPVLQYVYGICAWLSGPDRAAHVKLLHLFILLAEMLSIWLLYRLLLFWEMPVSLTAIYALNPLVAVELMGNLHAEAFMICFTLLTIYLLVKGRWLFSAVAMGLAICTKLWPLLFLPFLVKRIGWGKALVYSTVALLITALLFLPFWQEDLLANFASSVQLYFGHFEFNASIYGILRSLLGPTLLSEYAVIPLLTLAALAVLFLEDLLNKKRLKDLSSWPLMMMWALGLYLLFATTVHPWYVLPILAFSVFGKFRWPVLWSILLPLTYLTYANADWQQPTALIWVEYLLVGLLLLAELNSYAVWPWWSKLKARSKLKLIAPYLKSNEKVLEVGAGNGALTFLLREEGISVTALDIQNNSHFEEVEPVLASGVSMPFANKQFGTVQLITMLHHTADPDAVLQEAARVGQRLLIMEDVHSNVLQKYLTYFVDSLANMEFKGHPHTNRSDAEWRQTFEKFDLELVEQKSRGVLLFFRQETYLVSPSKLKFHAEQPD